MSGNPSAEEVADRMAILNLISRYVIATYDHDAEAVLACFGPNPSVDFGHAMLHPDAPHTKAEGDKEVREFFTNGLSFPPRETDTAFQSGGIITPIHSNTAIDLDGDRAHAETVGVVFHHGQVSGEPTVMVRGLRYSDDLVKHRDLGWRIQRREHRADWTFNVPGTALVKIPG